MASTTKVFPNECDFNELLWSPFAREIEYKFRILLCTRDDAIESGNSSVEEGCPIEKWLVESMEKGNILWLIFNNFWSWTLQIKMQMPISNILVIQFILFILMYFFYNAFRWRIF